MNIEYSFLYISCQHLFQVKRLGFKLKISKDANIKFIWIWSHIIE